MAPRRLRFWKAARSEGWPFISSTVSPIPEDTARGQKWPFPGQEVVRFLDRESGYFVDVEVFTDEKDGPIVTGIAVRVGAPLDPQTQLLFDWREGASFEALKSREARRLPLAMYADAAIAIVSDDTVETDADLSRLTGLRGRPGEADFYKSIAKLHRDLSARGLDVAPEIAARGRVLLGEDADTNQAYQWIFRARELGFLERPADRGRIKKHKKRR